jgi:hypothetical protein
MPSRVHDHDIFWALRLGRRSDMGTAEPGRPSSVPRFEWAPHGEDGVTSMLAEF